MRSIVSRSVDDMPSKLYKYIPTNGLGDWYRRVVISDLSYYPGKRVHLVVSCVSILVCCRFEIHCVLSRSQPKRIANAKSFALHNRHGKCVIPALHFAWTGYALVHPCLPQFSPLPELHSCNECEIIADVKYNSVNKVIHYQPTRFMNHFRTT